MFRKNDRHGWKVERIKGVSAEGNNERASIIARVKKSAYILGETEYRPCPSPSPLPPLSPITSANSFPVGILGKSGTRPMLFHRVTSLLPDFIFFSFLPAYFLVYSFANATSYKRPWNNSILSFSFSFLSLSLSLFRGSSSFFHLSFPRASFSRSSPIPPKSFVVKRVRISNVRTNGNGYIVFSSYNLKLLRIQFPIFDSYRSYRIRLGEISIVLSSVSSIFPSSLSLPISLISKIKGI